MTISTEIQIIGIILYKRKKCQLDAFVDVPAFDVLFVWVVFLSFKRGEVAKQRGKRHHAMQ